MDLLPFSANVENGKRVWTTKIGLKVEWFYNLGEFQNIGKKIKISPQLYFMLYLSSPIPAVLQNMIGIACNSGFRMQRVTSILVENLWRLKVHKRENFLGSDIEICTFS
jgi:hypothetical protein